VWPGSAASSRFTTTGVDLESKRRDAERSRLNALIRSANDAGVMIQAVRGHGDPARAIAAHADLVLADLIVIRRDFGPPGVWRTPGVAATVGRSASVPVLIVPSPRAAGDSAGTPFKKVVVAVDYTVASAVALRMAVDVVAHGNGRATVVHALPYAPPMLFSGGEASGAIDDLRSQLAQAEDRVRGTIPAGANHHVTSRVVAGAAGQAILDVAADVDADLVVMGVPRRSRFDELLFGSTFRSVLRRTQRPILAVPVAAGAYRWAGDPPAHPGDGRRLAA
jgi:nucleotide-binding universal stress UspA family protein